VNTDLIKNNKFILSFLGVEQTKNPKATKPELDNNRQVISYINSLVIVLI
jgi:hypothetical protein